MILNQSDMTRKAQRTYDHKIEIWDRVKGANDLEEVEYTFESMGIVWARIVPLNGQIQSGQAGVNEVKYSTKFIIKSGAIKNLNENMYFMFKNQMYQVGYFIPNYKNQDEIDIYTTLVI